jgi:hypothetical protein
VAAFTQHVAVLKDGKLIDQFPTNGADGEQLAIKYQEALKSGSPA